MEHCLSVNDFEGKIEIVKKIIRRNLKDSNKSVAELMENLPADEGKLIRAVFVLLGAAFGRIEEKKIMNVAAAIELLHLATLVHDDIIDETDTRRGRTAIHKRYNAKSALFSGDYLFAQSYVIFSNNCSPKSIEKVSETIKLICRSEVSQYFSLGSLNSSIRDYLKRINGKCASLFSLSLSIGAYEANANKDIIKKLKNIGYCTGMAFQLRDDILDLTSTRETLGKPAANDIKQGIYNLPVIYELKRKNAELLSLIKKNNVSGAIDLLRVSEGLRKAQELTERYTCKALTLINELPDIYEKQYLKKITEKLLNRNK